MEQRNKARDELRESAIEFLDSISALLKIESYSEENFSHDERIAAIDEAGRAYIKVMLVAPEQVFHAAEAVFDYFLSKPLEVAPTEDQVKTSKVLRRAFANESRRAMGYSPIHGDPPGV